MLGYASLIEHKIIPAIGELRACLRWSDAPRGRVTGGFCP